MTYIIGQKACNRYKFTTLISAHCNWYWLILEVETPNTGIYSYHGSVRLAVTDDIDHSVLKLMMTYIGSWNG